MIRIFSQSFTATIISILQIFLVIIFAGFMVKKKWVTQTHINGLSQATVNVFLPAMIFANVIRNLDPEAMKYWWILPLSALAMSALGLGIGWLFFFRELPAKKNLLPLASMQNAGYLVLPVGLALYPGEFERFALYTFLFILGYNPVLWSVGKVLSTNGSGQEAGLKGFFTPPFLANFLAVFFVLTGMKKWLPDPLFQTCKMLGDAAVPVATFVLGAVLGGITWRFRSLIRDAVKIIFVKQFLMPVSVGMVLLVMGLHISDGLMSRFLIIQAAAAPAVGIILQVRSYGGDEETIGGIMLLNYLAATLILPVWVAVWDTVIQYL